jgi:transcriptional regulator with XRE-family HTH domain
MATKKKPPVATMNGATFRRLRTRLRLSQAKLAETMGVSPNTVYRWEADSVAVPPPVAVLLRLLVERSKEGGQT